jgi:hypothetical protein
MIKKGRFVTDDYGTLVFTEKPMEYVVDDYGNIPEKMYAFVTDDYGNSVLVEFDNCTPEDF